MSNNNNNTTVIDVSNFENFAEQLDQFLIWEPEKVVDHLISKLGTLNMDVFTKLTTAVNKKAKHYSSTFNTVINNNKPKNNNNNKNNNKNQFPTNIPKPLNIPEPINNNNDQNSKPINTLKPSSTPFVPVPKTEQIDPRYLRETTITHFTKSFSQDNKTVPLGYLNDKGMVELFKGEFANEVFKCIPKSTDFTCKNLLDVFNLIHDKKCVNMEDMINYLFGICERNQSFISNESGTMSINWFVHNSLYPYKGAPLSGNIIKFKNAYKKHSETLKQLALKAGAIIITNLK